MGSKPTKGESLCSSEEEHVRIYSQSFSWGSRVVKGAGLKIPCISFVGSNPTSSTYSLKLLKYALQQLKKIIELLSNGPRSIRGEAKTFLGGGKNNAAYDLLR